MQVEPAGVSTVLMRRRAGRDEMDMPDSVSERSWPEGLRAQLERLSQLVPAAPLS